MKKALWGFSASIFALTLVVFLSTTAIGRSVFYDAGLGGGGGGGGFPLVAPTGGSATAPDYAWEVGDADTGFYAHADGEIFYTAHDGTVELQFDATSVQHAATSRSLYLNHNQSTATSPTYAFSGDTNTGIGSGAADTLSFAVGGVEALQIASDSTLTLGDGTNTWGLSRRNVVVARYQADINCAVNDGQTGYVVGTTLDEMELKAITCTTHTAGTTGTLDVQVRRRRDTTDADMLSTKLTIDTAETSSITAATAAVVDAASDDAETGDLLFIDVDACHTTAAKGLSCVLEFDVP